MTVIALLASPGCEDVALPPPGATDVVGRILSPRGFPVAQAFVQIGTSSLETDSDGRFRFANVSIPYDLVIGFGEYLVFLGVSIVNHVIVQTYANSSTFNWAYVTGRLPYEQQLWPLIMVTGPGVPLDATHTIGQSAVYVLQPQWTGEPSRSPEVRVLALRRLSQPRFLDFASRSVVLTDQSRVVVDFPAEQFQPVQYRTLVADVRSPSDARSVSATLSMGDGNHWMSVGYGTQEGSSTTFDFDLPILPSLAFAVSAITYFPDSNSRSSARSEHVEDLSSTVLELHAPPQLLGPADGATGIDSGSPFQWRGDGPNGVHAIRMAPYGDASSFTVYTTRQELRARDLPRTDLLQPGLRYTWSIETLFAATEVDALLSGDGLLAIHDRSWSNSGERTFTTSPLAATNAVDAEPMRQRLRAPRR